MKVTKYLHSCLLIEEQGKTILIDPGNYTYEAKAFPFQSIPKLDYLLITHEHPDHCHIPFIKEIIHTYEAVKVISNVSVVSLLQSENITATVDTPEFLTIETVLHENVVTAQPPVNLQFNLFNRLTDPGDSHHLTHTENILALPIQAPWGSFAAALQLAVTLHPQHIIPVHDWHWKDDARKSFYQRAEQYLKQFGITFHKVETGVTIEIL